MMYERIYDEQLDLEIASIRSVVDKIDSNDISDVFRQGQYALCRLVYILSRSDKLTPERHALVDNIVSDFDEKLRPALKYNGY